MPALDMKLDKYVCLCRLVENICLLRLQMYAQSINLPATVCKYHVLLFSRITGFTINEALQLFYLNLTEMKNKKAHHQKRGTVLLKFISLLVVNTHFLYMI